MKTNSEINDLKNQAAIKAVDLIENNMIVGLGTGSTASLAIEALAKRVHSGLKIVAISTSAKTTELAKRSGITLSDFSKHSRIDLTIDGADEVEANTLNLIKGRGGALLREKLVAAASDQLIIIVDETKLVKRLGTHYPVPVEVVPFAWQNTSLRLSKLGAVPALRLQGNSEPFITDNSNYILDCNFGEIANPNQLVKELSLEIGVLESGLFIDMANLVIAAKSSGVEFLVKTSPRK